MSVPIVVIAHFVEFDVMNHLEFSMTLFLFLRKALK